MPPTSTWVFSMQAPHHPLPLPKPTNLLSPIFSSCGSLLRSKKAPIRGPIEGKHEPPRAAPYLFGMAITRPEGQLTMFFAGKKTGTQGGTFPQRKRRNWCHEDPLKPAKHCPPCCASTQYLLENAGKGWSSSRWRLLATPTFEPSAKGLLHEMLVLTKHIGPRRPEPPPV